MRSRSALFGLIAGQVCLHASMAGVRMAAPLSVLRAGGAEAAIGPLLTLFALAPVALALPAGRLADRRGYHLPLRLAVALTVAGGLAAAASTLWPAPAPGRIETEHYLCLCLAAVLSGAGGSMGMIAIQRSAGRAASDPTALRQVFSWLGVAPSFSNVVGPMAAGVLIDRVGFWAAFVSLAVLPLVSLAFARLVPGEARPAHVDAPRRAAWDLIASPLLRRVLLVNWFMSASWDVHTFLIPVLGHERGMSASAIGSLLGVFALAVTAVRLVIPFLAHRLSEVHVLVGAMAIVATVFAIYPWAHSLWAMGACACVLGFALGSSQPMVMTKLHQITPPQRHGEAIALRSMALNLSSAVLPLGFAVVGAAFGAAGLFWTMAAVVASGTFVARALDEPTPT